MERISKSQGLGAFSPGPLWSEEDTKLLDQFAREWLSNWKGAEQKVNTYERAQIQRVMNIEYGTAASIDQLIMAQAYFGVVIDKVKALGNDVPRDLQATYDACTRDLNNKLRDERMKQIRAFEVQLEQLMSADEKRAKISAELARLKELVK